ncbi:hypothetical protein MBLNU457_3842t1 [Dothideomycetes sp. NU457]
MRFLILAAAGAAATIVSAGPAQIDQIEGLEAANQIQRPPTSPATVTVTVTPHTSILSKDHYLTSSWTPTEKDAPPLPTQTCMWKKLRKRECKYYHFGLAVHHGKDFRIYGKHYDPRFLERGGDGLMETTGEACAGCKRTFRMLPHNKTTNPDDWQFVYAYQACASDRTDVYCAGSVILQNGGRNADPTHLKYPWWDMCTEVTDFPEKQPTPEGPGMTYRHCK